MPSYRYRTATLLGPWRETAEAAVSDAIRAKQARRNDEDEGWHWVVSGVIEEASLQDESGSPDPGQRRPGVRVRDGA